jgi:tetratricopeptide (TPR) repeat protein
MLSKALSIGLSTDSIKINLDEGDSNFFTGETACQLLTGFVDYALRKKEFILADKLIKEALIRGISLVDKHFLYNVLIDNYYKLTNDGEFLNKCTDICIKDIEMFPDMVKDYRKERIEYMNKYNQMHREHGLPEEPINEEECKWTFRIPAFEKLINIYVKQKEYDKAIEVCETAIRYGYSFEEELEWIKKRQNKELMK